VIFGRGRIHPTRILDELEKLSSYIITGSMPACAFPHADRNRTTTLLWK